MRVLCLLALWEAGAILRHALHLPLPDLTNGTGGIWLLLVLFLAALDIAK